VNRDRPISKKTAPRPINATMARIATSLTGLKIDDKVFCVWAIDVRRSVNELFRLPSCTVTVVNRLEFPVGDCSSVLSPEDTPVRPLAAEFIR
jgi:hypothetical protein